MTDITPELVRTLMTDAQAVTVLGALGDAGIDALLLKGRSTRALLYAGGERPPSLDVDVLVAPDRVRDAERVLARRGYVGPYDGPSPQTAAHHADSWRHPDTEEAVDLH